MNLKYIIDNVVKDNNEEWLNFECFIEDLKLDYDKVYSIDASKNELMRAYYFAPHFCTDTVVGWRIYFLGDEAVCVTRQRGRKCDEEIIGWVSEELARKTKVYIESLFRPEEIKDIEIDILDLDSNFGTGYFIEFSSQLMTKQVVYQGQKATLINNFDNKDFHNINISLNGETLNVDIRDCEIEFLVKKEA